MNLLIQKQESLALLKNNLSKQQKKIFEIEMNIISLEKDIVDIIETDTSNKIIESISLSKQQKDIVESDSKNILVVACPGSGKTHTVIARYINLVVNKNIDPASIILITFTKKAGMEMNNRIQSILPHKLPYYVGSLHGLGYRLLQQYNTGVNNTVLSESEFKFFIKDCAVKFLEDSVLTPEEQNMIKIQIPYIYDKVSTDFPLDIDNTLSKLSIATKYKKIITDILKYYKNMKKQQHLVDFNDLMIQLCQLLGTKKINTFLEGIKYVFFDEYQDINPVQNYILKCFSTHSNIMAVGDDAQAIYAFRGSSIKYIWDFENQFTDVSTYYLETNYRSTPSIVNFFQDTINHNTKQFKKNVKSNMVNSGLKPLIVCHNNQHNQYEWVAADIIQKHADGVALKDIVVLSRTNQSVDRIEYELLKYSIPVIKSIGISLLNKNHIKDFIAFLIIINNRKSTIHWKRIYSCHRGIGISKANELINSSTDFDGMEVLLSINTECKTHILIELLDVLNKITSCKPKEKLYTVIQYLIKLWKDNKEKNIETKINDVNKLILFMGNEPIDVFISNLHLNIEIDNNEECIFLSTAHSAKGLEWDHVYIIDVNCKDFPSIKHSFYKNELDCSEEERRLFYVACSRAKKYLTITSYHDLNTTISPFIKEIDRELYIGSNLSNALDFKYKLTGYISKDVTNYLQYSGYEKIISLLDIPHTRSNILNKHVLPASNTISNREIAGNMMDILVSKMLQINFTDIIKNFDCSYSNDKIPQIIYHNYIDKLSDWRNILKDIFYMATYKHNSTEMVNIWKTYLLSDEAINYYNYLEKMIVKYIESLKPKCIYVHMNVSCEPIKGEIDVMIQNDQNILIEMKTTPDEACTFPNICQTLMYCYLLKKKQYNIDTIKILNLWDGSLDSFDMTNFDSYNKVKKILYSV